MEDSHRLISNPNYTNFLVPPCEPYLCTLTPAPPPPPPPLPTPIHIDHDNKQFLHNHAIFALTLLACIFVFSILATALLLFFYQRLRRRRLLAAQVETPLFTTHTPPPAPGTDPSTDPGDDPIHHVWYIRTVGLDEATIESIAVTQYRTGTELLGSADCSVCLGDFQDGDLVRLLPKCGHAFHVPCIDTWLRAHVNCPVCRSDVIDPTVTAGHGESTEATSEASPGDTEETVVEARENVEVRLDEQSRDSGENEQEDEVFDDIPLSGSSSGSSVLTLQTDSVESEPSWDTVRHRSASVDSPFLVPSVVITIPELCTSDQALKESIIGEEVVVKEKETTSNGSKAGSARFEMVRSLSSSGSSGRSFFFTRSGRSRSSVLPL